MKILMKSRSCCILHVIDVVEIAMALHARSLTSDILRLRLKKCHNSPASKNLSFQRYGGRLPLAIAEAPGVQLRTVAIRCP